MKINLELLLQFYNKYFYDIITLIIFMLGMYYLYLFLGRNNGNEEEEKWINESILIKRVLQENFVVVFLVILVCLLGKSIFDIKISKIFFLEKYGKLIVGVYLVYIFLTVKRRRHQLDFSIFLSNVSKNKYSYMSSENIFQLEIERTEDLVEIQKIKIDILKSLFPSTLIPLIVGYVLENKKVSVNWNMFTISFGFLIVFYFFQLWKSYKNLKLFKYRIYQIKHERTILMETQKKVEKNRKKDIRRFNLDN